MCQKCLLLHHHNDINRHVTPRLIGQIHLYYLKRWTQTDVLVNKMAENVRIHLILTSCKMNITNSKEIHYNMVKHGWTVELEAHVDLTLTAPEDESTVKHHHVRQHGERTSFEKDSPTQERQVRKHWHWTFPKQLEVYLEFLSSKCTRLDSRLLRTRKQKTLKTPPDGSAGSELNREYTRL